MIYASMPNVLLTDECPSVGELMDMKIRDVFDIRGRHPQLEDGVRLVGIGYVSPVRRPNVNPHTVMMEAYLTSNDYKVLVLV